MTSELIPMMGLKEGDEGVVHAISGERALISRLAALGIAPATRVKILRHSSGGLIIVQVGDTRMALGQSEAELITVSKASPLPPEDTPQEKEKQKILVGLAGQPNVGKSTVFNLLTGLSQHVGNWPGKTVEKKEGTHHADEVEMRIVDLPGTYSLTACSEEEKVARDFIISDTPDILVLLMNAAALERSLYLLSEMLLLGPPVIAAVNMIDVAEAQGIHINFDALETALGIPVVPMVATKNRGLRELVAKIIAGARGKITYTPKMPDVSADHKAVYARIVELLQDDLKDNPQIGACGYHLPWVAIKLMEGDTEVSQIMEGMAPAPVWNEIQALLIKHEDSLHAVVGGRYDWIENVTRAAVSRFKMGEVVVTDRIDHVLTRPVFGIPILLGIFGLVFLATYRIGFPLQKGMEWLFDALSRSLEPAFVGSPAWVKGLVLNGMIGGAGSVLTFIPILLIFFTFIAILEDVGYMARAAFVMDRFMHLIGLHGKSFIPMCLGFGCNVPAILGARIVESKKERLLTIFLAPFVPCTARLAVLTFVSAAVLGERAAIVSWGILTINILALGITGMLVSRFFLKGEPMPFIMELPLYHKPNLRTIGLVVWTRTIAFVKKAGTVILTVSVLIWLLAYLPDGRVETSILAWIGQFLEPIGRIMGFDWKMMTALLTSIVAKENAVATLGVLYAVGEQGLMVTLPQVMTHASALAFLVVLMLFVPCAATAFAMKQEMENRTWFVASLLLMLTISFLAGSFAYHIALWTVL